MMIRIVLIFCDSCNKIPQTVWLKNDGNVISPSPGGQECGIKVLTGPPPFEGARKDSSFLLGLLVLLTVLGATWLWTHHSSLCLCHQMVFFFFFLLCLSVSPGGLIMIPVCMTSS